MLVGCTLLNLAPSLYSGYWHGTPIIPADKVAAEAETYGLKIRTLISPTPGHVSPPFRTRPENENWAQFPRRSVHCL
jgi:hypothetical protein